MARDFLSLDEDDLYRLLGEELVSGDAAALPLTTTELIERGRLWLGARESEFRTAVCRNVRIRQYVEDADTAHLVVAVADLVALYCGGVPPFLVAALLIKRGLRNLCSEEWESKL